MKARYFLSVCTRYVDCMYSVLRTVSTAERLKGKKSRPICWVPEGQELITPPALCWFFFSLSIRIYADSFLDKTNSTSFSGSLTCHIPDSELNKEKEKVKKFDEILHQRLSHDHALWLSRVHKEGCDILHKLGTVSP